MVTSSSDLCSLFGALSDATRLAVVARLADGPASVSALAEPHATSRQSIMKHIAVLEDAGLVTSAKAGRVRTVTLKVEALDEIEGFVRAHRHRVERRLDRLGEFLTEGHDDE